jgi:hypothetical protein
MCRSGFEVSTSDHLRSSRRMLVLRVMGRVQKFYRLPIDKLSASQIRCLLLNVENPVRVLYLQCAMYSRSSEA